MRNRLTQHTTLAILTLGLTACAQSETTPSSAAAQATPPAREASGELTSKLAAAGPDSGDATLKSLNQDLASSIKSLAASLGDNAALQSQLTKAAEAVAGGNSLESLGLVNKLTAAKLTPEQMGLAKEVKNLTAAYAVQKDLGALEGARGDVATIVNGLRKGEVTTTLPAVQKVMQNASLTASQKSLLTSLADSYAPGLKKTGNQLQQGAKVFDALKGFGK